MKPLLIFLTFISFSSFCRADLTKGWFYTDAFPYMWSKSSNSWQYVMLSENRLWLYDYGDSGWSLLQSGQVLGTSDFDKGYAARVLEMKDAPLSYGLFSQNYMETERASSYNQGYQAGLESLEPTPITSGIAPASLSGKEIRGVSNIGRITDFVFSSSGQTGTLTEVGVSNGFDYFYEKTEPNTGTFSINTDTAIIRGEIEFTSESGGTFTFVHREFATREITATHTGTFTIE